MRKYFIHLWAGLLLSLVVVGVHAGSFLGDADTIARQLVAVADGKAVTAQGTANTALANAATADGKAVAAQGTANTALANAATADGKAVAAQNTANLKANLASPTFSGVVRGGDGSAISSIFVNGSASGAGGGAVVGVQNSGADILYIGNQSAILGGAYNATPYIYSTAAITFNQAINIPTAALGTSTTQAASTAFVQANRYDSGNIAWPAANTAVVAAHGFGAVPTFYCVSIVNTTADHGYSAGNEIPVGFSDGDGARMVGIYADATNIGWSSAYASGLTIRTKDGSATVSTTAGRWALRFRAWR